MPGVRIEEVQEDMLVLWEVKVNILNKKSFTRTLNMFLLATVDNTFHLVLCATLVGHNIGARRLNPKSRSEASPIEN